MKSTQDITPTRVSACVTPTSCQCPEKVYISLQLPWWDVPPEQTKRLMLWIICPTTNQCPRLVRNPGLTDPHTIFFCKSSCLPLCIQRRLLHFSLESRPPNTVNGFRFPVKRVKIQSFGPPRSKREKVKGQMTLSIWSLNQEAASSATSFLPLS